MTPLAFIDTETTGLEPDVHDIWEVALIRRSDTGEYRALWQLEPRIDLMDPVAAEINRFAERYDPDLAWPTTAFCRAFGRLTDGCHLVGNVVSFDEERLRRLLHLHGVTPGWHYHLVDVECLVAGRLGITPPWRSADLSTAMGVALPAEEHTAMGDAEWAMRLYDAAMTPAHDTAGRTA